MFKVHIFWEGHKILRNLHRRFDWHYIGQLYSGEILWPSQNVLTLLVKKVTLIKQGLLNCSPWIKKYYKCLLSGKYRIKSISQSFYIWVKRIEIERLWWFWPQRSEVIFVLLGTNLQKGFNKPKFSHFWKKY